MHQIERDDLVLQLQNAYNKRGSHLIESISETENVLNSAITLDDQILIGECYNRLALYHMVSTQHEKAIDLSKKAIEVFEELDNDKGIADAKYNLAGIYYKTNKFHLGMFYLIDALSVYRKYQDYHNTSRTLKSLGTVYELLGDRNAAIQVYEEAIEYARKVNDSNLESNAYNPLSGIYLKKDNVEKARYLIDKSITLKEETGDKRGLGFAIYGRGKI